MLDISSGRVVNPGHDIEYSWFLEEQAEYTNDTELSANAEKYTNTRLPAVGIINSAGC